MTSPAFVCSCAKYSLRGAIVNLAVDPDVPDRVYIDPTRVQQVVMNGLANAAKFGGGTPIELTARLTSSDEIVIEVLDSGRGLGGHTLEGLSAELTGGVRGVSLPRGPASHGLSPSLGESAFHQVRSTGMGIPICVRLAALMGGSLGLADRADGPGATRSARRSTRSCTWCRLLTLRGAFAAQGPGSSSHSRHRVRRLLRQSLQDLQLQVLPCGHLALPVRSV